MNNQLDIEELEELKEQLFRQKYESGIYLIATLIAIATGIYTWIITTFTDALPLFIGAMLTIELSVTKHKCYITLKAYIELIEMINDELTKTENDN